MQKQRKNKQKFPYYIVRFKQIHLWWDYQLVECFHTTQYDLNSRCDIYSHRNTHSFHTTQYDLNYLVGEKPDENEKMSFHTTQYDLNTIYFGRGKNETSLGFHTTQYDLNQTLEPQELCPILWFPYYIVRFKHAYYFYYVLLLLVSILHSTI